MCLLLSYVKPPLQYMLYYVCLQIWVRFRFTKKLVPAELWTERRTAGRPANFWWCFVAKIRGKPKFFVRCILIENARALQPPDTACPSPPPNSRNTNAKWLRDTNTRVGSIIRPIPGLPEFRTYSLCLESPG